MSLVFIVHQKGEKKGYVMHEWDDCLIQSFSAGPCNAECPIVTVKPWLRYAQVSCFTNEFTYNATAVVTVIHLRRI